MAIKTSGDYKPNLPEKVMVSGGLFSSQKSETERVIAIPEAILFSQQPANQDV
jgi:hypothetical protein